MFIARLATAVVLLAICIAGLFLLPNGWWTVLIVPPLFGAGWEWAALAGWSRAGRWLFAGTVLGSAILAGYAGHAAPSFSVAKDMPPLYAMSLVFWMVIVPTWLARGWRVTSPIAMGIAGWLVLVPAWLALVQLQLEPQKLLALLGIVWIADTAAYGAGRAWGTHKLVPSISPGKTWEGVGGAAAAVAVYYVALSIAVPQWGWWNGAGGAILFAAVALAGVLGDLFESWIKRQAGVKDSGALLPGHGGVLDRIDSITCSLPIAALLLPYAG